MVQEMADDFLWPQRRIGELEKVVRALLDARPVWEKFPRSAAGPLCIFCQTRCGHTSECLIQLAENATEEERYDDRLQRSGTAGLLG